MFSDQPSPILTASHADRSAGWLFEIRKRCLEPMKRIKKLLLFLLAQVLKPFLLMLVHNGAKGVGNLTPFFGDCYQSHPPIRWMRLSLYVPPAFERIDQPGNRRPGDDQASGDFMRRQGRFRVGQDAENKPGGRREVKGLDQFGYPAGQQLRRENQVHRTFSSRST